MALSTIYRMLARNGWRKLAPDTAHPKGDAAVREDWKKLQEKVDQIVARVGWDKRSASQRTALMM